MKKSIIYTDEPMEVGEIIPSFFLPPHKLVFKEPMTKVTLQLHNKSLEFFKMHAKTQSVSYQQMIRALLDTYVEQQKIAEARIAE